MSLLGATDFAAGYDLHMILNHPLKFLIKNLAGYHDIHDV
jgi:hypothetical protein